MTDREVRIRGRVTLEVESIVPEEKLQSEEHAANILKGGYYRTQTTGIDVEVDSIEDVPVEEVSP